MMATWKRFPQYWPVVRRTPIGAVDSHHKGPVMGSFCVFLVVILSELSNNQPNCVVDLRGLNAYNTCKRVNF